VRQRELGIDGTPGIEIGNQRHLHAAHDDAVDVARGDVMLLDQASYGYVRRVVARD
jgi:hypothetical protein